MMKELKQSRSGQSKRYGNFMVEGRNCLDQRSKNTTASNQRSIKEWTWICDVYKFRVVLPR